MKAPWHVSRKVVYDGQGGPESASSTTGEGFDFEFQARERFEQLAAQPLHQLASTKPTARRVELSYGARKVRATAVVERTQADDDYFEAARRYMDEQTAYANGILRDVFGTFAGRKGKR